jgi:hypothetical protein
MTLLLIHLIQLTSRLLSLHHRLLLCHLPHLQLLHMPLLTLLS